MIMNLLINISKAISHISYPNICTATFILIIKSHLWLELVFCPSGSKILLTLRGPLDANDNKVICLPNRLAVLWHCDTDAEGDAVCWHTDHPGDGGARVWVHPISAIFGHVSKTNRRRKWIIGESRGQTLEQHPQPLNKNKKRMIFKRKMQSIGWWNNDYFEGAVLAKSSPLVLIDRVW